MSCSKCGGPVVSRQDGNDVCTNPKCNYDEYSDTVSNYGPSKPAQAEAGKGEFDKRKHGLMNELHRMFVIHINHDTQPISMKMADQIEAQVACVLDVGKWEIARLEDELAEAKKALEPFREIMKAINEMGLAS